MLKPISTFNGIGLTGTTSVLGDIPIWQNPSEALKNAFSSGFTLANAPSAPALLPGGTPVQVNEATRLAYVCYRFELYELAADDATVYKIKKDYTKYGNLAKVGMHIMAMPAALTTAGAAYTITAIDTSNALYDTITLGTTLGAELAAGTVLAEADSTHGTTAKLKYVANALTFRDVWIQDDNLSYSVNGVYGSRIYNRRIRKIDSVERANLPLLTFSELK